MISAMKQNTDMFKHHKGVVKRLDSILKDVEILMEDPLFIDGIHGEQELSLDQALELIKGIKEQTMRRIMMEDQVNLDLIVNPNMISDLYNRSLFDYEIDFINIASYEDSYNSWN